MMLATSRPPKQALCMPSLASKTPDRPTGQARRQTSLASSRGGMASAPHHRPLVLGPPDKSSAELVGSCFVWCSLLRSEVNDKSWNTTKLCTVCCDSDASMSCGGGPVLISCHRSCLSVCSVCQSVVCLSVPCLSVVCAGCTASSSLQDAANLM